MVAIQILVCVLCIAALIVLRRYDSRTRVDWLFWLMTASALALIVNLLVITVGLSCYVQCKADVQEFRAVELTVKTSRTTTVSEVERAALQHKIVDANRWLANRQWWNRTIFDCYIPDEVESLEPLR